MDEASTWGNTPNVNSSDDATPQATRPSADTNAQRYAPWFGTYTSQRATTPKAEIVWVLILLVVVVVAVVRLVMRIRQDGLSTLLATLGPLLVVSLMGIAAARRPPMTRITAAGLTVRAGLLHSRRVAWSHIELVQPPGRFDDHCVAVLGDSTRVALPGLPVEVAAALTQVARPEAGRSPAHPPPPEPQAPSAARRAGEAPGDLEGPFRRG